MANSYAQADAVGRFQKDSLIRVDNCPELGFYHDYYLFIPAGVKLNQRTFLLVEPNNTGRISDSSEVHDEQARFLASRSSVGNNISTELRLPFLVPVFPRPASKPNTYTHALDRDVMEETEPSLRRLDQQLVHMIQHAIKRLSTMQIDAENEVLMSGFSASATFTNRFAFLHPELIRALAIGGFNGTLMLPLSNFEGKPLNYPLGISDFKDLFTKNADTATFRQIPQFIYMGELDENDAVQFEDAYSQQERDLINSVFGPSVSQRFPRYQEIYIERGINATFKTFKDVGHWTTSEMNLQVILFFRDHIKY
ncbi:MAG TPA: hypothetical protein VFV37_00460 [Luteibaculaceae bacterium]|nr:hypothetical protein [Luteibaculaceae bacterium]